MKKEWYINHNNKTNNIIEQILVKRGINTQKEKKEFIEADIKNLYDPYLFSDMEKAVAIIMDYIKKRKNILIYGDYDVDGITSISLLKLFLKKVFDYDPDYYIPDRLKEGYGLNEKAVKTIAKKNYDLIITVDCGITAIKEIKLAEKLGLKTIITDHHKPAEILPTAFAIINPKTKNSQYPFDKLAGVGIVYKLCQALSKKIKNQSLDRVLLDYIELAAIGTVADIVPLKDENRILVKKGLMKLRKTGIKGLRILLKKLGLNKNKFTAGHVGFIIAPPINAAGRLAEPDKGVQLFTGNNDNKLNNIAEDLIKINRKRQKEEEKTLNEALEKIEDNLDLQNDKAIILASNNWHQGVVGIVASRLVEKYYRPTILIAVNDDGIGHGSARSISNLNLYDSLSSVSKYLENFGGHSQAAGLTIKENNLTKFKMEFNKYLTEILDEDDYVPKLKIDTVITSEKINKELYYKIDRLAPFGAGNPKPVFCLPNIEITKSYPVGKNNNHLKLILNNGKKAIGFNMAEKQSEIIDQKVDIAFNITINKWKNRKNVELRLKDIQGREYNRKHFLSYQTEWANFIDKRNSENRLKFIKQLVDKKEKVEIFAYEYFLKKTNNLNKSLPELNIFHKTKDIKFPKSKHLVLISLPDSFKKLTTFINYFEKHINIYLLFNKSDYYMSRKYIKKRIPTANLLRKFYIQLFNSSINQTNLKEIEELLSKTDLPCGKSFLKNSLEIFSELGLVKLHGDKIELIPQPQHKLDLSESIRYNKNADLIDDFNNFCQLVYKDDLTQFINKLTIQLKEE